MQSDTKLTGTQTGEGAGTPWLDRLLWGALIATLLAEASYVIWALI